MRRLLLMLVTMLGCVGLVAQVYAATITVFAAASLKEALDDQARQFEVRTGDKMVVSYAGSNALAKQIESAHRRTFSCPRISTGWIISIHAQLLVPKTRVELLRNRLVLIAPADSSATIQIGPNFPLAAALGSGRLALANPDSVPAGKYAKAALQALGRMAVRGEQGCTHRKRPRRARTRCARRSAARHRLRDRRRCGSQGARDRDVRREHASTDRLSDGARRGPAPAGGERVHGLPRVPGGAPDLGTFRLYGGTRLAVSGDELGIILLSLKVALFSVAFSLPFAICRRRTCWRAASFPGKTLLDARRASAAGAATGRHRLCPAAPVRPARRPRRAGSNTGSASCSPSAGPVRRSPRPSWVFR